MKVTETIRQKEADIFRLEEILALLSWDQETGMPSQGIEGRSDQMAWIQQQISNRISSPEWETLLPEMNKQAENREDQAWYGNLKRRYTLNKCLPDDFMAEFVRVTSLARDAWVKARKREDFSVFQPHLEKVVELVRKRAELTGYEDEPYNALLDLYEPGVTANELESIFNPLQDALIPLIDKMIKNQGNENLNQVFPVPVQEKLHHELLNSMNYDLTRGRMDFSVHPFTTTTGPKDIRITTSLVAGDFLNGLYSTMHEAGHGLYEQNLPSEWARTLNGQACSLGIHESQSRMWENIVGRSEAFWQYFFPLMKKSFPEQMHGKDARSLYLASNRVQRSFIRIDADEFTYNLHVLLRFRIERMIVNGQAEVADLPELWKAESEKLFGIQPDTLCQGVLQDIHWSLGDWGYFPTYTLGNLYSAQIWHAMEQDLGNLDNKIRKGDFKSLLNWLVRKVHGRGAMLSPGELIKEVSGQALRSQYFIDYLTRKSNELYA